MNHTTMTTNDEPRPKLITAAPTNYHFPAMNLFFLLFQRKTAHCFYKNMQNKPNLNISIFTTSTYCEKIYPTLDTWYVKKNKPKANPNKAISKPISNCRFLFKKPPSEDIIPAKADFTFSRRKK